MKNLFALILFFSISLSSNSIFAQDLTVDSSLTKHFEIWQNHLLNRKFTEYYSYQGYEYFIRAKLRLTNAASSANQLDAMLNGLNIKSVKFKIVSPLYVSDEAEYYTGYESLELLNGAYGAGIFESPVMYIKSPKSSEWKFFYLNEVTIPHLKKILPNASKDLIIPEEKEVVLSDESYK